MYLHFLINVSFNKLEIRKIAPDANDCFVIDLVNTIYVVETSQ